MTRRGGWLLAGLVAGGSGLVASWVVALLLNVRAWPVNAVAEQVIHHVPGRLAESAIKRLGHADKPVLVVVILVLLALIFAGLGMAGARRWWAPLLGFAALAVVGGFAVAAEHGEGSHGQFPVVLGLVVWVGAFTLVTEPLRDLEELGDRSGGGPSSSSVAAMSRRSLLRTGVLAGGAVVVGLVAPTIGRGRRQVEKLREALKLPRVTRPKVPAGADLGLALPWQTPARDFYRVDTAISPPAVDPSKWRLRIHGMVDHPITLTFQDLLDRQRTESWITLNCVSNPVGGNLIGNAWWSGVRLAPILAAAGIQAGADAVLQTSADGWTCGTPLATLTDNRDAMLAIAMNGEPLPIAHGFPVRTIVPGLFGYVSACKWVVDLEVTTMKDAVGYWIPLGWAVEGPVKLASRIDRPYSGQAIPSGSFTFAGVAWEQETGIASVEVSLDGGPWQRADLATAPNVDTWVQWSVAAPVTSGHRFAQVRATNKAGEVQTSVVRDLLPDGATGLHRVDFEVR